MLDFNSLLFSTVHLTLMCADYWAFHSGELGPALISSHRFQPWRLVMKTLTLAAIRCSLIFTAVAALSLAYPASVQAVPTTYLVHREPIHRRKRPLQHERFRDGYGDAGKPASTKHTPHTGDAAPAFTLSDGVQTITNIHARTSSIRFNSRRTHRGDHRMVRRRDHGHSLTTSSSSSHTDDPSGPT